MKIITKIITCFIVAVITMLGTNLLWTATSTANAATEPIKLGITVWAPDFFAYLAQEKGFFEQNKVDVELTLIQDYQQALNNYSDGDFDGMTRVYSDLIYRNSQGLEDSRVVYAIDSSNTADAIIGNINNSSNNATLADVKGKKISVEGINSFSHLFVLKALEKVGLGEADVEFVDVPAQNVTLELEKGTIVAGHTNQPT